MRISTLEQLLNTLDGLFGDGSDWTKRDEQDHWAGLFSRPDHPLTSDLPDANLVDWRARGLLSGGEGKTALDIGCGLGRNTRYFARQGYRATGIDLSPYAVKEARERSGESGATFTECDVLRDPIPGGPYDVVYDSGCFHHLPPHRRLSYLNTLGTVLKPGGLFGICTFAPGQMGTEADDLTLFRQGRLEGGIAYSLDDLREVFSGLEYLDGGPLLRNGDDAQASSEQSEKQHIRAGGDGRASGAFPDVRESQPVRVSSPEPASEAVFAMDFLHAALFRRPD